MASRLKRFCLEIYKEMLAEFFGTFILVTITIGTSAQATLTRGAYGTALSRAFGSGIAVMMGVQISGNASGGHVNPAVSFALACLGKFSWLKVPFYMIAQYAGALLAAALAYGAYIGALYKFNGNEHNLETALIWTSFPATFLTRSNAFIDCICSAALLMLMNLAIADQKNLNLWTGFSPFFYGLIVTTITFGFSLNAGNPMNPARDLGPRLFLYMTGWDTDVLRGSSYSWWWIPVVAPHAGTVIGGLIYLIFISEHHPVVEIAKEEIQQCKTTPIDIDK